MPGPVKLSVHRNTRDKRRQRNVSDRLERQARELRGEISGYALVAFRPDGSSYCDWYRENSHVSLNILPEYVKGALARSIGKSDAAEIVNHANGYGDDDNPDDAA